MHTIEIEISEVDRQTAEGFCDIRGCLVATALMNRGHNVIGVGVVHAQLDTGWYHFDSGQIACRELHVKHFSFFQPKKPFYGRRVVGLKFSMTCKDYTPPVKTEDVQKRFTRTKAGTLTKI